MEDSVKQTTIKKRGKKPGSRNKKRSRHKFVLFQIDNDKVKYHSTQFGIFDTCIVTRQANANIYSFIRGKINTLGDWIVIKDMASNHISSTDDDEKIYYEQALVRFYKIKIQQELVTNKSINSLTNERIKQIYFLLNTPLTKENRR